VLDATPTASPRSTPIAVREVLVDTRHLSGTQQVRVILKDGSILTIPIGSDKIYIIRPSGGWGMLTLKSGKDKPHGRLQQDHSRRGNYAGP